MAPKKEIEQADKGFIRTNAERLSQDAHAGYLEKGRGAMLIDFHANRQTQSPSFYMTANADAGWPSPTIARMVNTYDPETQFIVILIGRPDKPTDAMVRAYRWRKEKRTTPKTPELTDRTTPDDTRFLAWVEFHSAAFAQIALQGYQNHGRGAVFVFQKKITAQQIIADYAGDQKLQAEGIGWPNPETAELVQSYDPAHECILVIFHLSPVTSVCTIQFYQGTPARVVLAA